MQNVGFAHMNPDQIYNDGLHEIKGWLVTGKTYYLQVVRVEMTYQSDGKNRNCALTIAILSLVED